MLRSGLLVNKSIVLQLYFESLELFFESFKIFFQTLEIYFETFKKEKEGRIFEFCMGVPSNEGGRMRYNHQNSVTLQPQQQSKHKTMRKILFLIALLASVQASWAQKTKRIPPQGSITMEIPEEWGNIEYEDLRELPESKLCDDSTTIRVLILNYVPEAGKTLTVSFVPIDFDKDDYYKTFDVLPNGTSCFKLHPCFPLTIWMRLGKGEYFPLLIEPGKDCNIMMDLEKGGTDPCVAFKGALAKTNYELNVLGGKDLITHDKSDAYFDSIIVAGLNPMDVFLRQRSKDDDKIENCGYSGATRDWLWMRAESEYQRQKRNFDIYFAKKVHKDMESAGSILMNNKYTRSMVGNTRSSDLLSFVATSSKLTLCPHYEEVWTGIHSKDDRNFSSFIQDLYSLHWAVNYNEQESYEAGQKWADKITDPTMKAFYPIAAKRWNDYVESIKRIPHIHYDEHGDWYDKNQKEKLLEDYRGKNVVFLVYNRDNEQALSELEEIDPIMAKTNSRKMVFIHIDTNFMGVRGWLQSARRWHGEHYGGKRSRYDSMFDNHGYSASGILYELHAPDGATTLSTTDKKEALEAIKRLR